MDIYSVPERRFYVYLYLRSEDSENGNIGTPYYVGKGVNQRAFTHHRNRIPVPKDKSNIQFHAIDLLESEAFAIEMELIQKFGRIDNGTGCLRNRTDGGEGTRYKRSLESRQKQSQTNTGRKRPPFSEEWIEKMRLAKLGKTRPKEVCEKIASYLRNQPEEVRKKRADSNRGKKRAPRSQEWCEKLRQAAKRKFEKDCIDQMMRE